MVLKWGRFGQFLACSGYPDCKNTREVNGGEAAGPGSEPGGGLAAVAKSAGAAKVKAQPDPIEAEAEPCEKCGKAMVLKRGRFGQFLACSGYPECKNTRKIRMNKEGKAEAKADVLLEEDCPRCGSELVLKPGRFGEFTAFLHHTNGGAIQFK